MYDPAGHISHFMNKMSDSIHKKMEGCAWQLIVLSIDAEMKAKIVDIKTARKSSAYIGQRNTIGSGRYGRRRRNVGDEHRVKLVWK